MVIDQSIQVLIVELFNEFEKSPTGKPVLPAGTADQVIAVLTQAMMNAHFCAAYAAALRAERDRRGRAVRRRLLGLAGESISDARLIQEGFVGAPDHVLADLALSPEAVEGMLEVMYDPTIGILPGAWFFAPDPFNLSEANGS